MRVCCLLRGLRASRGLLSSIRPTSPSFPASTNRTHLLFLSTTMARLSPPVKATTPAQKVALILAHMGALVSVILTARWANGAGEGYLGGLDWGDDNLIFNWHPVLMVSP